MSNPTWTREAPKERGFYWYRDAKKGAEWIHFVCADGLIFYQQEYHNPEDWSGEWCGPLEVPE